MSVVVGTIKLSFELMIRSLSIGATKTAALFLIRMAFATPIVRLLLFIVNVRGADRTVIIWKAL